MRLVGRRAGCYTVDGAEARGEGDVRGACEAGVAEDENAMLVVLSVEGWKGCRCRKEVLWLWPLGA